MALHVIAWHRMREHGARARSTLDRLETVEGAEDVIVDAVSTMRRRRFFFPWMWLRRGVEERSSSSSAQLRDAAMPFLSRRTAVEVIRSSRERKARRRGRFRFVPSTEDEA